ncbi:hypothetical protein BASA61_000731 [Batrachochytrium salamandrivorans]|nr:hypothetical protein BASA61_000731 [Batrachochytrium salamandrivorans]
MFASMHGWNLERRRKCAVASDVDTWAIRKHTMSVIPNIFLCCSPPPASGASEKYSNNVDTTLASGLEARSYQPVLNSQKDLATLTSLKRRDDSEGLAGEPSRSDPSPPFTSSLKEIDDSAVTESNLSTKRLASTIDKAEMMFLLFTWTEN